ncbi:MAG: hypothetical protein ACFFE8_00940 [Candidatus Heimdallarchaeota archaeon]
MANPLWLPKGSIRALLTITVALTTLFMVLAAKEQIPRALGNVLIVSVAFYYSTRASTPLFTERSNLTDLESPPPLFLPTRTVRATLAIIVILSVAITFLKQQEIPIFMITVILTIFGFILGVIIKKIVIKIFPPETGQKGQVKEILEHFQAGVILLVVIGVCGINIASVIISMNSGQLTMFNQVLELAIGYYFGSRTVR